MISETNDDVWVDARAVISDAMRLAFDGYQLIDHDTENTVGMSLRLTYGQNVMGLWPHVFIAVRNQDGIIAKERARPLLLAMVHFLNAGGDPADICSMLPMPESLPKLEYPDFELSGVYDESEREVYYITKDKRVIRVIPGLLSEEVSQEELDEDEEEDASESG